MRNRIAHLLEPAPEYTARVEQHRRGWFYLVHRGAHDSDPTVEDMLGCSFGVLPSLEMAWACALAHVRGMMAVDRANAPR